MAQAAVIEFRRNLTRRRFVAGGAALAALPLLSRTSAAAEVDVVVVGAGAAGLSATRELLRQGASVATLEASSRVGGRAWTNLSLFGVPYDVGAHWLHHSEKNPFVQYAKDTGFTVYPAPDAQTLHVGGREGQRGRVFRVRRRVRRRRRRDSGGRPPGAGT